jgi:glycosyltransferase involved in cell wall biosynthesis
MKNNKFIIIMPSYNVAKWVGLSLETLKNQSYKNFECVFVDDCSKDDTVNVVKKHIEGDDRFHLITNDKNNGSALANHIKAFDYINPDDEDIIVRVDGDDWLSSVFSLEYLNHVYNNDEIWMTYGTYQIFPSMEVGDHQCIKLPKQIHNNRSYRKGPHVFSHLRTHKAFLFKAIDRDDMIDPNTNDYYAEAEDCAHLFAIAEMCGEEHMYCCEDILYILNRENPLNDGKIAMQKQKDNEEAIRSLKVYDKFVRYDSVKALDLLSPKRFDILAKYLYAKGRANNYDSQFHLDVYREHLYAWNKLHSDFDKKYGLDDYVNSFDKIIDSIGKKGFDSTISQVPIVAGKSISPLNGAHRVAAGILHNKTISCKKGEDKKDGMLCDYNYLKSCNLDSYWMDMMALEYAKLKDDTFVVSLFPSCSNTKDEEVREILKEVGEIVYEKDVQLNKSGGLLYTIEMYQGEPWIGNWNNRFHGANNKSKLCFMKFPKDEQTLRDIKTRIRNLFNIGNHSVHINDTHEETVRLCKLVLNDNSIHFLNNCRFEFIQSFESQLQYFKNFINTNKLNIDDYCITASSVLSRYGLRPGDDLDYLHRGDKILGHDLIRSHNEYSKGRYSTTIDDVVYNPKNHFYYNGVKYASLDIVKQLKLKRAEPKDLVDVKLICEVE